MEKNQTLYFSAYSSVQMTSDARDVSDNEERKQLEVVMRKHCLLLAKDILARISGMCSKKRRSSAPDRRTRPHRRQDGVYHQAELKVPNNRHF
jgi:hypothetical protein